MRQSLARRGNIQADRKRDLVSYRKKSPSDTYEIRSSLDSKHLGGILIEAFPHKSFKQIGLGRSGNGNFVLTGLDIRLESKKQKTPPIVLKLDSAEASFAQKDYPRVRF